MTHRKLIEQVDAAMAATRNIYPPITRSQCQTIILAAREYLAAPYLDDPLALNYAKLAQHCAMLEAKLAAPEQSELGYATRLAEAIYKQHYKDDAPEWKPLPDLMGVLTQIDNMFADLYTHPAPKAEPVNRTLLDALKQITDRFEQSGAYDHDHTVELARAAIKAAEQAQAADECTSTGRCVRSGLYCPTTQPAELTDAEILAANHPDGVENGETIRCPDYELIAFGRQVLAAQGAKT